ncbi:hypothetical protein AMJ83_05700 [candidate division WOR_3 bacterium SM23_42]|uniref:Oxidoreductase n=1 Tax=candidate division WOR_3 bacterium SM23_42 TaxID=1703779 RepID=A0A0S8FT11_UNCW3|nr:MAG: hypothetical protein AMJ83_05700 [candidate division WOR_3 bacterium SM23_42]
MKLAVIGLGHWGHRLIPKFLVHPRVDGLYCHDVDASRRAMISKEFPEVIVASDYASVLANPEVDAVFVATPVATHYDLAKKALEHGKHVLVEKPLTNSVRDAQALVELAATRKLTLMVDHITIYHGAVRKIKDLIDSQSVGDIIYIDAVRVNLGIFQCDVNVVWDLAIHEFAIIDYLLGEMPRAVTCVGAAHYGELEEAAYVTLFFGQGVIAHIHVSWLSPVKTRRLILGCTRKMLLFDDTSPSEKLMLFDRGVGRSPDADVDGPAITYRDGATEAVSYDTTEPLFTVIDAFLRSIHEKQEPLANGESGLRMVRILEAASKSLKQQGVRIPLD